MNRSIALWLTLAAVNVASIAVSFCDHWHHGFAMAIALLSGFLLGQARGREVGYREGIEAMRGELTKECEATFARFIQVLIAKLEWLVAQQEMLDATEKAADAMEEFAEEAAEAAKRV